MKRFIFIAGLLFFLNSYSQKFNSLALTPPMGWNSWNKFGCDGINEKVIRDVANVMAASGMKSVGYEYIVIDDCWEIGRDSAGNILADPTKFPSGIKALVEYVHSKKLKFGIYSCGGIHTCAGRPGSHGYEFQDARQYAIWGVDYLKYDWYNTDGQNAKESYKLMRDALYIAKRPIVFSMCEWRLNKPWEWAADISHLWRTTGDIENVWAKGYAKEGKMWGGSVLTNLDMQRGLEKYAGPGHWNDPDMLEVGNGVLTTAEERAHFSLWCMLAAPLMAGNDFSKMSDQVKEILMNNEVIAVDQDSLGKQGHKIVDEPSFEIYLKTLSKGDTAICLFNRGEVSKDIEVNWHNYKIPPNLKVRDLWAHKEIGNTEKPFKATIPSHDVIVLRLHH